MTDITITQLSEQELITVNGGGWSQLNIPKPNININVKPQLSVSMNFNIGVIVVAGNKISAPLYVTLNQIH